MAYEGMALRDQETGFTIARDVAGAAVNPVNWYRYNPGLWNVGRGQVKIPFLSGRSIKAVSDAMNRQPWLANQTKALDNALSKTRMGGILTSKSVWFGLKDKGEAGLVGLYMPQDKGLAGAAQRSAEAAKAASRAHVESVRGFRSKMYSAKAYKGPVKRPWFTAGPVSDFKEWVMNKGKIAKITGATGTGIDRAAAAINKIKFKGIGKGLARGAIRGAVGLGKGFAILSAATLAWEAINYIAEPLGRAAFSAMDAGFRAYEGIPNPELGGQLSLAYLSNGAATERQRALRAISKAHINGRSALGGEAQYAHR